MAPMVGTTGKAAWRMLAAVPFVLLLGIVGIKATAGDPSSPFNKIPGAETIQELGEDAPSSNVNVKLPKSSSPKPTKSATASTSPSAEPSDATTSAAPTQAPAPTRTPKPEPTRTSNPPKPSPTPTRTTQEPTPDPPPTCEEKYAGKPLQIIQCNNGWIS